MQMAKRPTSWLQVSSRSATSLVWRNAPPKVGNCLPLDKIPPTTSIHCLELMPGRGAKVARSAGQAAILTNTDGEYALVRMPSGESRRINARCYATIGIVGNAEHMNEISAKAGRTRWQGVRPTVRGMAMNPVDHPNGGVKARAKSGGGRQHLKSPWGHPKGLKTRKRSKPGTSLYCRAPGRQEVISRLQSFILIAHA